MNYPKCRYCGEELVPFYPERASEYKIGIHNCHNYINKKGKIEPHMVYFTLHFEENRKEWMEEN